MRAQITILPVKRQNDAARWAMHVGGGIAFLAAFGSLYVMCGAVAAGFDPRQALLIDVSAFGLGWGLMAVARMWQFATSRFGRRASVPCNFARKTHIPETQMARTPKRSGHLVAGAGLPVPA